MFGAGPAPARSVPSCRAVRLDGHCKFQLATRTVRSPVSASAADSYVTWQSFRPCALLSQPAPFSTPWTSADRSTREAPDTPRATRRRLVVLGGHLDSPFPLLAEDARAQDVDEQGGCLRLGALIIKAGVV